MYVHVHVDCITTIAMHFGRAGATIYIGHFYIRAVT